MGLKFGGSAFFLGRGAGSSSNTKSTGPRPTSKPGGMHVPCSHLAQQIWAENWGLCPFGGRGAGSPSNTMWPGRRPTCMPSFILIHPTVWPQCTNVTERQTDRQDRQTGQRTDSIGRTVLQTVVQKRKNICRSTTKASCFLQVLLYSPCPSYGGWFTCATCITALLFVPSCLSDGI